MKINIFIFIFFSQLALSHVNKHVTKTYGNITVESSTYFISEEINKNLMIGKYAELLSAKLLFKSTIQLYLIQDSETEIRIWKNNKTDSPFTLTVFIKSPEKDVSKSLSLIFNAILQFDELPKDSKTILEWYNSISDNIIIDILNERLERPDEVKELHQPAFFTYYFKNEQFHIVRVDQCESKLVAVIDDLYQFEIVKPDVICLFSTLGLINIVQAGCKYNFDQKNYQMQMNSMEIEIKNSSATYFKPFETKEIGIDKIYFEENSSNRVLLYSLSKHKVIQDLDKLFSE